MDRRKFLAAAGTLAAASLVTAEAWADKSKAEIEAPAEMKKGGKVKVKIKVTHEGNSRFHHTDWVTLKSGGKEVKRWEYGGGRLPPDQTFAVEHELAVEGDLLLEAEAHCNVHGSAGAAKAAVKAV